MNLHNRYKNLQKYWKEHGEHTLEGFDDREILQVKCEDCPHSAEEHSWKSGSCFMCDCLRFEEVDVFTRDVKEIREEMR